MKSFLLFVLVISIPIHYCCSSESAEFIDLGRFTPESINSIISTSAKNSSGGQKVEEISSNFLGVPYLGFTLIGSEEKKEVLTINLSGLDCFTYLDYVEALRHSSDFDSFKDRVRTVRYKNGIVEYGTRKHFFSDWPLFNSEYVKDVTSEIGGPSVKKERKLLNLKKDGSNYLPGIPVVAREITYIPTESLNQDILNKLRTGDYIGIYSDNDGLDVSHTGIVIRESGTVYMRHASSRKENKKVLDEELLVYMKNKPGLVVYRPI